MGYSVAALRRLADQIDDCTPDRFMIWRDGVPHYPSMFDDWLKALKAFGAPAPSAIYDGILSGAVARPTPALVATADRRQLIAYATYVIRGERFAYGHVGACQESGLLGAILRRRADLKRPFWFF